MTSDLIADGPLAGLRRNGYDVILADPPWAFETFSEKGQGKSPQMHYPCMGLDDIVRLPVADLASPNCALILWGISPMWIEATEVLRAWGFQPKTKGGWAKQSSTGQKWHMSTGFILRGAHEDFYVGTKGKPKVQNRGERNLIVAPVREHSRKPEEAYEKWERLYGDVPRVELFARASRPGWDSWGNEKGKFDKPLPVLLAENARARERIARALA